MATAPPQRDVYTVSRLNAEVQALLEGGLPLLWIEGEISNFARPASGHIYFTLKDERAQVRAAMFRNRVLGLLFKPVDGAHVLVRARASLYGPRGEFQLIVEHMEEAGFGALMRAFETLKAKLAGEGLFDTALKRPLPRFPRQVGVITSPTGAAIRDILSVLRRRFPALPVLVHAVPVQGDGAAEKVAAAIRTLSARDDCDVVIVARGGGSIEDLWAFNEEVVARAIHTCHIPVVTGIGHEVDFTIADFAADLRAPTPSAAAEAVSPDGAELAQSIDRLERRLDEALMRQLVERTRRVEQLAARLALLHPARRLQQRGQRLEELERRLLRAMRHRLRHEETRVARARTQLRHLSPERRLQGLHDHVLRARERIRAALRAGLAAKKGRLEALARALHTVSPLATLGRGYGILTTETGHIMRDAATVEVGERIEARLAKGRLRCRVEERNPS